MATAGAIIASPKSVVGVITAAGAPWPIAAVLHMAAEQHTGKEAKEARRIPALEYLTPTQATQHPRARTLRMRDLMRQFHILFRTAAEEVMPAAADRMVAAAEDMRAAGINSR